MKKLQVEKPEQARALNGGQLIELAKNYAMVELNQISCPCRTCLVSSDDSHYFAVALAIVGAAAVEDCHASLYEVLTKWAQDNLADFPPNLRGGLYQAREENFPEIIGQED